ncbi:MAG TPA: DNA polymerase III subunit alpha [Candidatus Coprenecus stercorigallinarum]|nr:DNA polymerase III subunit alpha [Candidatus Coprenecus stercorigallinarum]
MSFAHLHVHTQYSILDGQSKIEDLLDAAIAYGQPALAVTDHGNMFAAKEFLDKTSAKLKKVNESRLESKVKKAKEKGLDTGDIKLGDDEKVTLKPIVGSEFYVAGASRFDRKGREDQSSYHLIMLAKNMDGYHNLIKLSSKAYIEGFYYKPRIDHELIEQYHEGIVCCSACLGGEVPQAIMEGKPEEAERIAAWYKSIFGDDYYLEVQRHETNVPGAEKSTFEYQQQVNAVIFQIAEKLGIKVVATNDVHFVRKEDGPAHDRLICISTNSDFDDPKRLRYTQQEYLKSTEEMSAIFADHPEVISNTLEIVDKCEVLNLNHDPILPVFPLPEGFTDSNDYLHHLTYEGAHRRYGEDIPEATRERIDFELATIKKMGFPDYFLIVQDFIKAARDMGVWVGPGRGSAAGSVVAYCLTITNIDPIKYDLLFERFLNPDRISMPDIDIDFDDEGRYRVFKYVEDKYGKDHVSHVITFGTMATKSVIRDVGRIQKLSLETTDRLAKLVPRKITVQNEKEKDDPDHPGEKKKVIETKDVDPTIKLCLEKVPEFKEAFNSGDQLVHDTLMYAERLEGTVRNTGVHACATIIGRDDLTNFIPLSTAKDKETGKDILVSQFEGSLIESAGMLKMDFLGLKTLTILKDTVENIRQSRGVDLDVNTIPIDDAETYALFSRGDTIGVFQFESEGMQKWLIELQPSRFEDLIAMNALYRPGPMDYIPDFVNRKHGRSKIEYDLPDMEEYLHDTYGVTVYQEQVMLLSQKLAGFTKGKADKLRKAMGKKQIKVMAELKDEFFAGGLEHGHPEAILNKIWNDWEAFASYAFNKSHATCYAWVGYQTGYLKAHYRAEYMAAVLSNNLNNIDEITKFMDDCRRSGMKILGPDVNESYTKFTVNKDGNIRFGMAGIKGIGIGAVNSIIEERRNNGPFNDIFNFMERVPSTSVNKKGIEALAYSGAFDSFAEINRGSFAMDAGKGETCLDLLIRYGSLYQKTAESMKNSLFGGGDEIETVRPPLPVLPELDQIEMLKKEKELVGMYISAHPLDRFRFEIEHFTTMDLPSWNDYVDKVSASRNREDFDKDQWIAGLVSSVEVKPKANGNGVFCRLSIEDFKGTTSFVLFDKDYEAVSGYLRPHEFLLMRVYVAPRYKSSGDKNNKVLEISGGRVKIRSITLLANVRESMVREMVIDMPLERIDAELRKNLKKAVSHSKGKSRLAFNVYDRENRINVEFVSRKYSVLASDELLRWLNAAGLHYRINK